jgi:hypothetical protein
VVHLSVVSVRGFAPKKHSAVTVIHSYLLVNFRVRFNRLPHARDEEDVMKRLALLLVCLSAVSCASKHEKASQVTERDTRMKDEKNVREGQKLGVKDDKVVVQRKVMLSEQLRDLENATWSMQFDVYGNRQYGTIGTYGAFKECRAELDSPQFGGRGKMQPIEPAEEIIKDEPLGEFTKDENGDLVGVTEEFLSERIERFQRYRALLEKRRQEYETKLEICENDLKSAKARKVQSAGDEAAKKKEFLFTGD